MAYTQENIQFSESVVKYNLINFLNFLIDMGSLSGAGSGAEHEHKHLSFAYQNKQEFSSYSHTACMYMYVSVTINQSINQLFYSAPKSLPTANLVCRT